MKIRVVTVRAGGMQRRIAVRENDAQIRARVNGLYGQFATAVDERERRRAGNLLDIWLAIECELCPIERVA